MLGTSLGESLDRFFKGTYAGDYEAQLVKDSTPLCRSIRTGNNLRSAPGAVDVRQRASHAGHGH